MGEHQGVTASPEALAVASAGDAFGADLHVLLAAVGGNTVFSPASVAAALHLALLGARGDTAAELAAALHVTAPDEAAPGEAAHGEAAQGLRLLSATLDGLSGDAVTFRAPNTLWVQSGMPLLPAFTAAVEGIAWASVRQADFARAAEEARRQMNAVIAEQTSGKIADLVPPGGVGPFTRLVLANAVYLKAPWADPFPPGATEDAPFHLEGGVDAAVPMMKLETRLNYLRGDGYQAVVLPYADGRLAMTVILPDGPLAPLEAQLPGGGVGGLVKGVAPQRVRLRLPRFRQDAGFRLVPALGRLGVSRAFGDDADFSGMTTATALSVSDVVHKAFIDVDEVGTEAAAATAVVMRAAAFARPTGEIIEMTVDRPFLFAIFDTATRFPLFLGRVTHPTGGADGALRH